MERRKKLVLIGMSIYIFFVPGCRLARVQQQTGEYVYKGSTLIITADGKAYSRLDKEVVFRFSPYKVSYQYVVEDQVIQTDFDASLSKVSIDQCRYYYAKEINNLFVLDDRRKTLQVYGSDDDGKRMKPYSGHTFLGLTRIEKPAPLFAQRN